MFSYYLQDRSYYLANCEEVEDHLKQLNNILLAADQFDHFLKRKSFLNCLFDKKRTINDFLYGSEISQSIQKRILPTILRRFKDIDHGYMGLIDMDAECTKTINAFVGPKFTSDSNRLLTYTQEYIRFRLYYACANVTGRTFEKCCKVVFKRIVVEDDAFAMVRSYGKEAKQIFDDLKALDDYIDVFWTNGQFDVNDVRSKTKIDISDESDTTKSNPKYKNKRFFNIPGIGGKYCFIHIKSGSGKRSHIYPDEINRIVHVPYIGPHLPTTRHP